MRFISSQQGLAIRISFPGYNKWKRTRHILRTVVIPSAMDDGSKEACQFMKTESLKILQKHEWKPGRLNKLITIRKIKTEDDERKYGITFSGETVFFEFGVKPHIVKVQEHGLPKLGRNYVLYQWLLDHGFDEDIMPTRVKVSTPELRFLETVYRKVYYKFPKSTERFIRKKAGEKGIPLA